MAVNPMMAGLRQARMAQALSSSKNLLATIKNAGNPQAMFGQMLSQNPRMKQVMDYINANGGDPKAAFYKAANEAGVDPEEILRQLNV